MNCNWLLSRNVALGLAILATSASSLFAQATLLPPVISTPPPTGSEMPYVSDRAVIAPNMFGAVLGTRWFVASGPGFAGGTFGGPNSSTVTTTRTLSGYLRDSVPSNAAFLPVFPTTLGVLSSDLNYMGVALTPVDYTSKVSLVGFPTSPSVNEVAAHTAAIQAGLAKPGETAQFNSASHAERIFIGGETTAYQIFLVYDFISQKTLQTIVIVPNPADGGLAGRNRVSTDSSPVPRDRLIFNYDFVSNTNLYPTTPTMNRFVLGFEKTFFNGLASVEFRAPFASTVSSTSHEDGIFGSGHGEFGNLFVILKSLLWTSDTWVFSGGMGISIPTADDVRLNFGGPDVLKIRNEAVILTPFVAALWTPSDRLFAQTWLGFGFDTNGNPAQIDVDGAGLRTAGKLYDPTTIQVDLQLGYWLIHPSERRGTLRGLAPFVEFHYNQQTQAQNSVTQDSFLITSGFGQLSEFNLTTGFAAQFGANTNLMIGATFPMSNEENRFSDWQIGLRLNYFFGPTGRARINAFN